MTAFVRGNSEQSLLFSSEEGTEWKVCPLLSRGSFIDKHHSDASLYLQDPSPWLQHHHCSQYVLITTYSVFTMSSAGPKDGTSAPSWGYSDMWSDLKMQIKLLSGERGNQPQQEPAVPLLILFLANLIVTMRGLTGYTRTHCPLSSRHCGPIKATSVSSGQFKGPKALNPCYA